jgi:hypothetical protein
MFRVEVDSLEAYFAFDPARKSDLERLDALIGTAAPSLERYFHKGTPAGEPGMRFKMIGYGPFHFLAKTGKEVLWPVIGVALQKNYISVYFAVTKNGAAITDSYRGRLGELRSGDNNFSFRRFSELDAAVLSDLVAEAASIFGRDQGNPVRPING